MTARSRMMPVVIMTCACLMRATEPIKEIQTQLGRRSPMITLIGYTHLFGDASTL